MKQIFTYPDNAGTSYIDPDYVGDANTGFTRRMDALRDGNYLPWNGLDPVVDLGRSTADMMASVSTFEGYLDSVKDGDNLAMYDFWYTPVVRATKQLIGGEVILTADTSSINALITVSGTHEFADDMKVTIAGMDGSWSTIDDADYFAEIVGDTALKLKVGGVNGPYVRFYNITHADLTSSDLLSPFTLTFPSVPFVNGDPVETSEFNGDYSVHNNQTLYVQNKTATTLQLSYDQAGTNLLGFNQSGTLAVPPRESRWGGDNNISVDDYYIIDTTGFTGLKTDTNDQTISVVSPGENDKLSLGTGTYNLIPSGISDSLFHVSNDNTLANRLTYANVITSDSYPDPDSKQDSSYPVWGGSTKKAQVYLGNTVNAFNDIFNVENDFSLISAGTLLTADRLYFMDSTTIFNVNAFGADLYNDAAKTSKLDLSALSFERKQTVHQDYFDKIRYVEPLYLDDGFTNVLDNPTYTDMITYDGNADFNFGIDYTPVATAPSITNVGLDNWYPNGEGGTAEQGIQFRAGNFNSRPILKPATATSTSALAPVFTIDLYNNDSPVSSSDPWKIDAYELDGGVYVKTGFHAWAEGKTTKELNQPIVVDGDEQRFLFVDRWVYTGDVTFEGNSVPSGYYEVRQWMQKTLTPETPKSPSFKDTGLFGWDFVTETDARCGGYYVTPEYDEQAIVDNITDLTWFDNGQLGSYGSRLIIPKYHEFTYGNYRLGLWSGDMPVLTSAPVGSTINPLYEKLLPGTIVNFNGVECVAMPQKDSTGYFRWYHPTNGAQIVDFGVDFQSIELRILNDKQSTWTAPGSTTYIGDLEQYQVLPSPVTNGVTNPDWYFTSKFTPHWDEHLPVVATATDYSDNHAYITSKTITSRIYEYDDTMPATMDTATVPATTGHLREPFTAADAGQIGVEGPVAATTGSIAPATDELLKWELSTVSIDMPGNQVFSYQDTNNTTVYEARINPTYYFKAGNEFATNYEWNNETSAIINIGVDANGRLSSATLSEQTGSEGKYRFGVDIVLPIESLPDQYVEVITPAEQQDIWDTADQWDQDGYNRTKLWPTHIAPTGIKLTTAQPSVVNRSQNGTKYVRSLGLVKQQLEVSYPPMSYDNFRQFEATVEAARGQATPFNLQIRDVGGAGNNLLMARKTPSTANELKINSLVSSGDKTILLDGFASNEINAIELGEALVLGADYANGGVVQTINSTNANVFGEAKIRIPYASRASIPVGEKVYADPYQLVVTLATDELEYTVGTDGYYRMSVMFDLDEWK